VWLIGRDGLRGIQVKAPAGRTGFIDQSVLRGLVAEECNLGDTGASVNGLANLESVLERTRIIDLPHGDWQAVAPAPSSFGLFSEPIPPDWMARAQPPA
jgi:hypothetical protein